MLRTGRVERCSSFGFVDLAVVARGLDQVNFDETEIKLIFVSFGCLMNQVFLQHLLCSVCCCQTNYSERKSRKTVNVGKKCMFSANKRVVEER